MTIFWRLQKKCVVKLQDIEESEERHGGGMTVQRAAKEKKTAYKRWQRMRNKEDKSVYKEAGRHAKKGSSHSKEVSVEKLG